MTKGSIQQDITIVNIYASNIGAPKYININKCKGRNKYTNINKHKERN